MPASSKRGIQLGEISPSEASSAGCAIRYPTLSELYVDLFRFFLRDTLSYQVRNISRVSFRFVSFRFVSCPGNTFMIQYIGLPTGLVHGRLSLEPEGMNRMIRLLYEGRRFAFSFFSQGRTREAGRKKQVGGDRKVKEGRKEHPPGQPVRIVVGSRQPGRSMQGVNASGCSWIQSPITSMYGPVLGHLRVAF